MVRTRVGYTGGITPDPTYKNIGDHAEVIQVDYDPEVINYVQLLTVFWDSHLPPENPLTGQYRPAVFYENEVQHDLAASSKAHVENARGAKLYTEVLPLDIFYNAEDYHQKYVLRQHALLFGELTAFYPDPADFRESTVAARLNCYLHGNGTSAQLEGEIARFGLSEEAQAYLRDVVANTAPGPSCGG